MVVHVEVVREATREVVDALGRLLPQLSPSAGGIDATALARLLAWDGATLLVARLDGEVVGTLTLAVYPTPTACRAWIEDVVVAEPARGQGVGAALTREAVRLASEAGAQAVDLTSRPARAAANRLYQRLGFQRRQTNLYRLSCS